MNKKRIRLFIALLICSILIFPQNIYAKDVDSEVVALVEKHIEETIVLIPDTSWTEYTEIDKIVPTYNADNVVNGYIVTLITNDTDSGYIQLRYKEDNLNIIAYTFAGTHRTSDIDGKIYYLGNLNFAYKTNDDCYYFDGYEPVRISENDLKDMTVESSETVEVSTYNTRSINSATVIPDFDASIMVTFHDFPGYVQHCAPTAGTSWVKYWGYCRGMSSLITSNGATMTDEQIFQRLYTLMETTSEGTTEYKVPLGINSYANEHSVILDRAYYSAGELSFTGFKNGINSGTPVLLQVYDHPKYDDHVIIGVGYFGNMAIIMDGWDVAALYIDYSEIGIGAYYEIGF